MFIGAYRVCPKVADVYAKVGDFYPKAWDRQTKGEVRKFFIGSREVFCYRFERGIEKNVIFVT